MRTVGQLLKETRIAKGFSLEQIERATKIRAKFISSIELDDYRKLPAVPYVQGFIKNYGDFLGLRSTTLLALFRRQYLKKKKKESDSIEQPLTESGWKLTPNKVILTLVVILILILSYYFYSQYRSLHQPPPLTLQSPKEDLIVKQDSVPVYGDTDPDATISINNEPILVKSDGKFYKDIALTQGNNTIVITVTSRAGEKTTLTRKITRAP